MSYQHAEAFCLMNYTSDDGRSLLVWNSRDGVTAFSFRWEGVEYVHRDWNTDMRAPAHVPAVEDLVWIDATIEDEMESVAKRVDHWWEIPEFAHIRESHGNDKGKVIRALAKESFRPGAPHLMKVTPELRKRIAHDHSRLPSNR